VINPAVDHYYSNNCNDSRVTDLGLASTSYEYQEMCSSLAFDFGQNFYDYKCNDWFCNLHGKCNSKVLEGSADASCTCETGWAGSNCMFTTKDHEYAIRWAHAIESWMNTFYPVSTPVSDIDTFYAFVDMTDNLISLSPNVNLDQQTYMTSVIDGITDRIFNTNITVTDEVTNKIFSFINEILNNTNGLTGLDPTEVLSSFAGNKTVINDNYGSLSSASNKNIDISLSFISARVLFAKNLYNRFLADASKDGVNMASPKAIVPKDVSASLPTSAKYQLSFIRDPKPYNKPNSVFINSQVVTVTAKGTGNTTYNFPTGASAYTVYIPWTYIPFTVQNKNYTQNCVVNSYTNSTWSKSNYCKFDISTNENNAVVLCTEFSTFGVSCKNAKADASVFNTKTKSNGSNSSIITISSILIALVGLLLF
jgi:hypothetical protein